MSTLTVDKGNYTYGILDFDGNILHTPTSFFFLDRKSGKIEEISQEYLAQNLGEFYGEDAIYKEVGNTYSDFRDVCYSEQHRGFNGLISDIQEAIENEVFASSFPSFKDFYLVNARPFSILTMRGNSSDNFANALRIINDMVLSPEEKQQQYENIIQNYKGGERISQEEALHYYFVHVASYIPCNNPHTEKMLRLKGLSGAERKAKSIDILIHNYVDLLKNIYQQKSEKIFSDTYVSIGFSDDTVDNIYAVYKKFEEILHNDILYPNISKKFSVYFTGAKERYEEVMNTIGRGSVGEYGLKIKM